MVRLTDKSLMTFGKYQGYQLANVPAGYLIWLYENASINESLKAYIKDNLDALKMEKKRADNEKYK